MSSRILRFFSSEGATVGILLVAVVVLFSLLNPVYLTSENIENIVVQSTFVLLIAVGMTFVLITGGIDLSVGSVLGLSAGISVLVLVEGGGFLLAVLAALAVGFAFGLLNGMLIAKAQINDFIVTLATLGIAGGALVLIAAAQPLSGFTSPTFTALSNNSVLGIPLSVILTAVIVVALEFVLRRTGFGRVVFAVGINREAAHLSGLNVDRTRITVFVISGVLASVAGVLLASRLSSVPPRLGQGFELQAIAAAVLAGTSLDGRARQRRSGGARRAVPRRRQRRHPDPADRLGLVPGRRRPLHRRGDGPRPDRARGGHLAPEHEHAARHGLRDAGRDGAHEGGTLTWPPRGSARPGPRAAAADRHEHGRGNPGVPARHVRGHGHAELDVPDVEQPVQRPQPVGVHRDPGGRDDDRGNPRRHRPVRRRGGRPDGRPRGLSDGSRRPDGLGVHGRLPARHDAGDHQRARDHAAGGPRLHRDPGHARRGARAAVRVDAGRPIHRLRDRRVPDDRRPRGGGLGDHYPDDPPGGGGRARGGHADPVAVRLHVRATGSNRDGARSRGSTSTR